jgi:hypothetical protein
MPNNIINASSAGSGGLITTAADSGSLELQSDGTTIATLSSTGLTMAAGKKVFSEGSVLQVITVNKTDTFSMASATWADVTGLSLSITPTSASNKIMVLATVSLGASGNFAYLRLVRDSTVINVGDAAGSRVQVTGSSIYPSTTPDYILSHVPITYLDSPSTTSATTYKIQIRNGSGGTAYINRTSSDRNTADYEWRSVSNIVVMEVKG